MKTTDNTQFSIVNDGGDMELKINRHRSVSFRLTGQSRISVPTSHLLRAVRGVGRGFTLSMAIYLSESQT